MCDGNDLKLPGWYRFTGDAGSQMATSCVPTYHCGSHTTGWMNGAHPSVADGAVIRKVCYNWDNKCCQWSNNIRVRNCGKFYVYQLQKSPACWSRYCGSNGGTNFCFVLSFVRLFVCSFVCFTVFIVVLYNWEQRAKQFKIKQNLLNIQNQIVFQRYLLDNGYLVRVRL